MQLSLDMSVQFIWAIANTEAFLAHAPTIGPIHFLLGLLKFIDPTIGETFVDLDLSPREIKKLMTTAKLVSGYLELTPARAKSIRRSIRKAIRPTEKISTQAKIPILHRSPEMREIFKCTQRTAILAGDPVVTAFHVAQALFDSGKISLQDCRTWPSKSGSDGAKWKTT